MRPCLLDVITEILFEFWFSVSFTSTAFPAFVLSKELSLSFHHYGSRLLPFFSYTQSLSFRFVLPGETQGTDGMTHLNILCYFHFYIFIFDF